MGSEVLENNMQNKIKQYIEEILKEIELPQVDFDVELPKDI
jgi:hypothetical protein